MNTSSATVPLCGHCGRPVVMNPVIAYGNYYHFECTQSPYIKNNNRWIQPPLKEGLDKENEA